MKYLRLNKVFLGRNLNFTIRVFTWDLASDDNICKRIEIIQYQICEGSQMKKYYNFDLLRNTLKKYGKK